MKAYIKKKITPVAKALREHDTMVRPIYRYLHGSDEYENKTVFGGMLTWCIKLYILYAVYICGAKMISSDKDSIQVSKRAFNNFWDKIYFNSTSKIIIELWEGGINPEKSVKLDFSTRKYIRVHLK